jgi:hypothetical protein
MKDKIISFVPYYGIKNKEVGWLELTINSMKEFSDCTVIVNNDNDYNDVKAITNNIIKIECDPLNLPIESCKFMQNSQELLKEYDYICYNESDQIVKFKSLSLLLDVCANKICVTPNRIEEVKSENFSLTFGYIPIYLNSEVITLNNKLYVLPNRDKGIINKEDFYINDNFIKSYGACFLCTKEHFNTVSFEVNSNLPLESPSICMFKHGFVLKTTKALDFYVIHLSAERWLS